MWVRLLQLLATSTIHKMIMLHTVKMTSCQIGSLNETAIYNSVSLIQQEVVEVLAGLLCFSNHWIAMRMSFGRDVPLQWFKVLG